MSAYSELVLSQVCRSNHHRIAIMALDHLKGDDAELWRNLFLKWHPTYLEGSKAPDEQFKDFKNHVVHPKDNFWGGAPQAAAEWYKRFTRALGDKDWEHAAWSAGVMSHYIADPCQPFHTDQCEAENVVHRAAEWSFSKAFPELKLIIEQHVGFPEIEIPQGDDWVAAMVRKGAEQSNPHYHALIDHYNIEAARKNPVAGLDQEAKDIAARMIAYATVNVARIYDRAFAEARVAPPKVDLTLATVATVIKKPVHAVKKQLDHVEDQKLVAAQYEEYRKTGKVRATLSDDDKTVRALHADEVRDIHLSSLDAEWPRETGLAHGTGAPPRVHKKLKKSKLLKPDAPAASETTKKAKIAKAPKPPTGILKPQAPSLSPSVPVAAAPQLPASPTLAEAAPAAAETRAPATSGAAPIPAPAPSEGRGPRLRLTREASVVDAPSIGPKTAGRLQVIGVKTVGDLLGISPDEAAQRIKASHINARVIRDWQAQALLACSVPDITGTTAQMLVGAGVHSAKDLAVADPAALLKAIADFAKTREGEGALRGAAPPDQAKVEKWIEAAKAA